VLQLLAGWCHGHSMQTMHVARCSYERLVMNQTAQLLPLQGQAAQPLLYHATLQRHCTKFVHLQRLTHCLAILLLPAVSTVTPNRPAGRHRHK
jgi:hypothetical protein